MKVEGTVHILSIIHNHIVFNHLVLAAVDTPPVVMNQQVAAGGKSITTERAPKHVNKLVFVHQKEI